MHPEAIQERLAKIRDLATLPVVAGNVIQLTRNPRASARDVGKAISQDPALAARVLRTANSAFYGFPSKITTIPYAIVVLGFNNIRNIVLSTTLRGVIGSKGGSDAFDREAFWKHSLACGIAARQLAERLGLKNTEEAFMWGLLHDLGKLVMDMYLAKEYAKVARHAADKGILIRQAEMELLGFDHCAVGSQVAEKWNLPPSLIQAIRYHHDPEKAGSPSRIAAIVQMADILCRAIGMGNGGDRKIPSACEKSLALLSPDKQMIKSLFYEMEREFESATAFLDS